MLNGATVTLAGYVAREPYYTKVNESIPKVVVRVAWNSRFADRVTGEWKDGKTSFANVNCWRKMAPNVVMSLRKGQPIVVTGRLQVREYDDKEGRHRTAVDIEADAIGHDLSRGVGHFQRLRPDGTGAPAQPDGLATGTQTGNEPELGLAGEATVTPIGDAALAGDTALAGYAGQAQEMAGDVLNADAVGELVEAASGAAGVAVPF